MMSNVKSKINIIGIFALMAVATVISGCNNIAGNSGNTTRKIFTIEKWHVSFSISEKYSAENSKHETKVYDSTKEHIAFVSIIDKDSYGDSDFKTSVTKHSENISSAGGHGSFYEGDSITSWKKYKNSKSTEINKLFIQYVLSESNDTSDDDNGYVPDTIIWKITKREVLGPFYYIEVPDKYRKELNTAFAYYVSGDSVIVNDILDDFEIK